MNSDEYPFLLHRSRGFEDVGEVFLVHVGERESWKLVSCTYSVSHWFCVANFHRDALLAG